MSKNPITEIVGCYGWYQDQDRDRRSHWHLHCFVHITRADGSMREYGNKGVYSPEGEPLWETGPLSDKQWQRIHTVYKRLRRRKGFEAEMDYRPAIWHQNNEPYWYFTIRRKPAPREE